MWNPTNRTGDAVASRKLSQAQVDEIRRKYVPYQYSRRKLAKEYSVCYATIFRIVTNQRWRQEILPNQMLFSKHYPIRLADKVDNV